MDEYLRIVADSEKAEAPALLATRKQDQEGSGASPASGTAGSQLSNQELRALKKTLQSTERKMGTMRGKIDDATARLHAADPTDFKALGDIQGEIDDYQAQLEELELIWLETAEALER